MEAELEAAEEKKAVADEKEEYEMNEHIDTIRREAKQATKESELRNAKN